MTIEIEEQKEELRKNQQEISRLTQSCRNLKAEIFHLKKERLERDEIIQEKVIISDLLHPSLRSLNVKSIALTVQSMRASEYWLDFIN